MSREAVVTSLRRVGIPFNGPPSRKLTRPVETGSQVLKAITCKQSTNARLSILILSKAYPTSGNYDPTPNYARLLAGGVCLPVKPNS